MNSKRIAIALVIVVSALMITSSLAFFPIGAGNQGNAKTAPSSLSTAVSASQAKSVSPVSSTAAGGSYANQAASNSRAAHVLSLLKQDHVPMKYVYLPNFAAQSLESTLGSHNSPGYLVAPAPMGVADYGIMNTSKGPVAYNYSTSSFKAVVNITSLQVLNAINTGPHEVTFQLNAILNGVTIQGTPGYQFWNQNVLFYTPRVGQLTFLDNVWNFSSPAGSLLPGSIISGSGTPVYPVYYYSVGPTIPVAPTGFTVTLYLNTTTVNGNDVTFFNYSLETGGHYMSGSYDEVVYNSVGGQPSTYTAPAASYVVNGSAVSDLGFIPMDAEIMVGGPGGGSTATIANISGYMQLQWLNGTKYQNPKSAYDFGSETGETSSGVAVSSTSVGTANLETGPSILYQLWQGSSPTPSKHYSGTVSPANAFLLVSDNSTSFDNTTAQWAPTFYGTGSYSFTLNGPWHVNRTFANVPGVYRGSLALSGYDPVWNLSLSSSKLSTAMTKNSATGVYTPLYAYTNAEAGNLFSSGTSLINTSASGISSANNLLPEFGAVNDYTFPAFAGINLFRVSGVKIAGENNAFAVQYSGIWALYVSFFGLPTTNQLGVWIVNSTGITIANNAFGGWLNGPDVTASFPTAGSVILWNVGTSSVNDNLFVGNDVYGLVVFNNILYSTSNNVITGNLFSVGGAYGTDLGLYSGSQCVLPAFFTNNQVIGNRFAAGNTIVSPLYSPYSTNFLPSLGLYRNEFDLGTPGSGNYYWNFNGAIPYTNGGQICCGGDYNPANLGTSSYNVVFHAVHLPAGSQWTVDVLNSDILPVLSMTSTLTAALPNGTFSYVAFNATGKYLAATSTPANTSVTVNGHSVNVYVTFNPAYNVTIDETGLPGSVFWSPSITPVGTNATANGTALGVPPTGFPPETPVDTYFLTNDTNGTYSYSASIVYSATTPPYMFSNINGTLYTVNLTLTKAYFGTSPASKAQLSALANGSFAISGANVTIKLTFQKAVKYSLSSVVFLESSLPFGTPWTVTVYNSTVSYSCAGFYLDQGSSVSVAAFEIPNGTYNYSVAVGSGYRYYSNAIGQNSFSTAKTYFAQIDLSKTFVNLYGIEFNNGMSLAQGLMWSVTIGGMTASSTTSCAFAQLPVSSTAYTYTVTPPAGYRTTVNGTGSITLSKSTMVNVTFAPMQTYTVTFTESGLSNGTAWTVEFNGVNETSTSSQVIFYVYNGTYSYNLYGVPSFSGPSKTSGTVNVSGSNQAISVSYTAPSVSAPLNPYLIIAIIAVVLVVVIGVAYFFVGRPQRKS